MSFWTSSDFEPVKGYQFRFSIAGKDWWWAKSVTLPSFEINQSDYQLVNFKFKYPGLVTWNDVTLTAVESGESAKQIIAFLTDAGYQCPGAKCSSGLSKKAFHSGKIMQIEQLDAEGKSKAVWELNNWWIKAARFGEHNYESDDFINVEMTIGYDCAVLDEATKAEEKKAAEKNKNGNGPKEVSSKLTTEDGDPARITPTKKQENKK